MIKGQHYDAAFCSDLKRAVDTANIVFSDIPIIEDVRLRECNYGIYNGQPSSIVEPIQKESVETRFPEGESYEDVKVRIASLLEDLKANYEGKSIAIVAHKAPQLALDVLLNGKSWQQAFSEDWRKTRSWQPGWRYEAQ